MTCNIDSRGRVLRLAMGVLLDLAGVTLLALHLLGVLPGAWALYAAMALMAVGTFGVFEGAAGWCAVRAMGFKTRV